VKLFDRAIQAAKTASNSKYNLSNTSFLPEKTFKFRAILLTVLLKYRTKLINYYKLLEIPDYSDPQTIRAAYLSKVKQYHPDLHKNPENEEIIKWINTAYHTLSKPSLKQTYDYQLQSAYLAPEPAPKTGSRKRYSKEELANFAERARQSEMESFERADRSISYAKRIAISAIFTLCGAYIVYLEWFRNEDSYDHFYLIGGAVLFLISLLYLTQSVYRKLRILHIADPSRYKQYENVSVYGFAGLMVLIPLFIWQASIWRRAYHLSHYAETTIAELLDKTDDKIVYAFLTPDQQYIMKIQKAQSGIKVSSDRQWILIRYSRLEPRIAEVVTGRAPDQPLESPTK